MSDLHLWMQAWSDHGERVLTRVESAEKIDRDTLAVDCTQDEFRALETALYQVLHRTTANEPLKMVQQVEGQRGFEAWHLIVRRIANVEQIKLGNIMELSITGQLFRGERQANMSGGVSLCKANGWNVKNHSHIRTARRLREKIHPMMLIVTIRKYEDRGICSATLRELWRVVKDQIKERTAAVVVMSKYSAIWRRIKMKSVMQEDQLKYVDAEGMRIITNSKHVAEQIKSDKDKCVAMDDQKITETRKIGGTQNLKSTVMDGVKFGKVGKWENSKIDEEKLYNHKGHDKTKL